MSYNFDENLLTITDYQVLGKLPDPFLTETGGRVQRMEEFERHKSTLYKSAIELQYGTMPPPPEFLDVAPIYISRRGTSSYYRITTGKKSNAVSFIIRVILPVANGKHPVIINGDLCFNYADQSFTSAALDENIGFVLFNRTELANDIQHEGRRKGPLYNVYPEYTFGALGAWAWGYSRCVDALEKLDLFDLNCITFSGHSRGGKTAILAGALDPRAAIVNPNETCAGACGCYRIHMQAETEYCPLSRSETLADLWNNFAFWMGPDMGKYAAREQELPFDAHFLKALVAPRILFVSEAAGDIWANPLGSWMTTMAASEVYKFYQKPENLFWYYRRGGHAHTVEDMKMLINIIKHKTENRPISKEFYRLPFKKTELIFDWRAPQAE